MVKEKREKSLKSNEVRGHPKTNDCFPSSAQKSRLQRNFFLKMPLIPVLGMPCSTSPRFGVAFRPREWDAHIRPARVARWLEDHSFQRLPKQKAMAWLREVTWQALEGTRLKRCFRIEAPHDSTSGIHERILSRRCKLVGGR